MIYCIFIYLFYYSDMYIFYINNKYSKYKKYPALYWAYKSLWNYW